MKNEDSNRRELNVHTTIDVSVSASRHIVIIIVHRKNRLWHGDDDVHSRVSRCDDVTMCDETDASCQRQRVSSGAVSCLAIDSNHAYFIPGGRKWAENAKESMKTLYKTRSAPPPASEGSHVEDAPHHSKTDTKKSGKKKLAEEVLEIATRESAHKSFGRALLEESFVDYEIYHHGKLISYNIKAPPSLCADSMTAAPNSLRVSAMLALFDELSTMALFVFDQTRRPGVSVDLKTEILQPIFEGQTLRVNTIIEKTGKILAFCSLEVYNEAGALVARGSHVKFMPMGWLWDLFAGAFLLPIAIFLYNFLRGRKIKTPLDAFFRAKKEGKHISSSFNATTNGLSALYKSLQVMPYQPDDPEELKVQEAMKDMRHGVFSVKVRRDLMNPVKSMHGGAVACSIEEACRQYLETQYPSECTKIMISQLFIQYQAPLKVREESKRAICLYSM